MPGPAGPPRQLNRFISLSLKHFGLPRWLRQKNLPAVQETWVRSLGWDDPLEKEMATHSSILAWKNLMDRGAWWAAVHGVAKSWAQLSD